MSSHSALSEIDCILERVLGDRQSAYRQANWLKCDFESNYWKCVFSNVQNFDINFDVYLDDGKLLTSHSHSDLLCIFKTWLTVQTHADVGCGKPVSPAVACYRVRRTLHLIDYFLLNQTKLKLSQYGLACVTENDLRGLVSELCGSNSIYEAIYRWIPRLTDFLRHQINHTPLAVLDAVIKEYPLLACDLSPIQDRVLPLSDDELVYSRAWLWTNGYYRYNTAVKRNRVDFRFSPNTELLARTIYANTLKGKVPKPMIRDLFFAPIGRIRAEFSPAPVFSDSEAMISESSLKYYFQSISSLQLLAEVGLNVPVSTLDTLSNWQASDAAKTKSAGRYRTLPSDIVFAALNHAITFILNYGEMVVDATIFALTPSTDKTPFDVEIQSRLCSSDCEVIQTLGVKYWSLSNQIQRHERHLSSKIVNGEKLDYHRRLRDNEGLRDLILVLYGAVAVCIGTLMARRSSELLALHADTALDESSRYLIFGNAKSGVIGLRETEARPIPKIAAQAIKLLIRLQDGLIANGYLSSRTHLFSYPKVYEKGMAKAEHMNRNESIDLFCDYVQLGLDPNGCRYYIRQHQLRRFFAMMFFWGSSFGKMDTLRWFMGHTDVEHLYHYITESTPGAVLQSVKAQYATEQVQQGNEEFAALAEMLEVHFGTRKFSVLDSDELDEYIEELLLTGSVEIEPSFYDTPDGKSYRVLVKVSPLARV